MPVEVEGIRLIADLVVAGDYASILPETAIPPELEDVRTVRIRGAPPRRLAMVSARRADVADLAVRDSVRSLVEKHMQVVDEAEEAEVRKSRPKRERIVGS